MTEAEHTKTCYRCKETKARSEFNKNQCKEDGLQGYCKACCKALREINGAYYEMHKHDLPETKRCTVCGEEKRRSKFSKDYKSKDGLHCTCKSCNAIYSRARAVRNKLIYDASKHELPLTKVCTACKIEQDREAFGKDMSTKDGLKCRCQGCDAKYSLANAAYYDAHKHELPPGKTCRVCKTEKERSNFSKDRTQKDGLDGKCVACSAVYTETHRAEAHIWYLRDYKNNIEKYFARSAERRSAKLNATPPWFERAEVEGVYKSAITRSKSESIKYHVDHIVPLQSKFVCGLHCLANLQIIPGEDNISKGNRYWPDMWEITDDHYWLLDAQKDV